MKIWAMLIVLVVMAGSATAWAASKSPVDSNVVGEWGLNGQPFATFKADGTGLMEDGPFRWTAEARTLAISDEEGTERIPYQIRDGRLVLTVEGQQMILDRMKPRTASKFGGRLKEEAAKPGARDPLHSEAMGTPAPVSPGQTQGDQLSQLLLSSAWCSFSYNKVSGASHTSRAQFSPDGTWSAGSRGETYSSGSGGTVAGQHDAGNRGQWKVQNGQLFMSNPPESPALAPITMSVKRNSNGSPIITADGTEYSQCR